MNQKYSIVYLVPILNREQKNQQCSFPLLSSLLSGLSPPAILATSRTYHMNPGQVLDTLLSTEALKCYGFYGVFSHPHWTSQSDLVWAAQFSLQRPDEQHWLHFYRFITHPATNHMLSLICQEAGCSIVLTDSMRTKKHDKITSTTV